MSCSADHCRISAAAPSAPMRIPIKALVDEPEVIAVAAPFSDLQEAPPVPLGHTHSRPPSGQSLHLPYRQGELGQSGKQVSVPMAEAHIGTSIGMLMTWIQNWHSAIPSEMIVATPSESRVAFPPHVPTRPKYPSRLG